MYPKVSPKSNSCGFNIIKVGRGERTAGYFPKGSNILWGHLKITDYYKINIASLTQRLLSNFVIYHWFRHEMTCEKETEKFHTDAK